MHAVVFELDDTLYPERQFVLSGFRAVDDWLKAKYRVPGFFAGAEKLFCGWSAGEIIRRGSATCRGRARGRTRGEIGGRIPRA